MCRGVLCAKDTTGHFSQQVQGGTVPQVCSRVL
jgi:hypothetical protein